ncbi:MAG: aminotransferase class V-fold PLP-dependent enzyme [Candidatus Zixiibacteriota bacterium]
MNAGKLFPGSSGNMIRMNFNVGPSHVGPEVARDMREAIDLGILSISHRSQRFYDLYAKARAEIFRYFSLPDNWQIYFLGTGSEAMEAACRGLIEKRSFHHVNGNFSERAYKFAGMINKDAITNKRDELDGFKGEPDTAPEGADCAFFCKTETATGVTTSAEYIKAFREKNPDVTIVCDVVSVVPTEPLDTSICDYYFFGVQKGCGLPAGLGVALCSPQALEKCKRLREEGLDVGANRALITMDEFAKKDATLDTPNVLQVFLLGRAFERFNAWGLAKIEEDTRAKADLIYDWLENSEHYFAGVSAPELRAMTAVSIKFKEGVTEEAVLRAASEGGYETGLGYGHLRGSMIRISNFPAHTLADHKALIEALEKVKVDAAANVR